MMNQKNMELGARLSSAVGIVLGVLGLAFLAGSGLAYLQRVATQIISLAATGVICFACAAALARHGNLCVGVFFLLRHL